MNVKVEDLMQKNVCYVKPGDVVGKIKRIFAHNHFNVLPVIKNDEIVGIVSQSDILMVDNDFSQVHNYMTTKVVTVTPYSNVNEAAALMRHNHIHHLIVVHEKKMIGILSTYDLLSLVEKHVFKYHLKESA